MHALFNTSDTESPWSEKMNDCNRRRNDSSLCSYNSANQRCCGCRNCLELTPRHASWKPEKFRIFYCDYCDCTTILETRSLYINGRPKHSYSTSPVRYEWHCSRCGYLNSSITSNHKNSNLMDAKNLERSNQTISTTSVLTSESNLCKHSTPSCSHHSQKYGSSTQCKYNKECNENIGKSAKNGACNCSTINEPQIDSSSKVAMETIKWVTTQETSIVRSTNAVTATASLQGLN